MMASSKRSRSQLATSGEDNGQESPILKRRTTVYDATAGRASQRGLIPSHPVPHLKHSDLVTEALVPARPDEVLFRRKGAPMRYAENDYYFAHSQLPENALPGSDLVKAVHGYIAGLYQGSGVASQSKVWESMDETALLALAILLEETARGILGETGDLAFVEGEEGAVEGTAGMEGRSDR